MKKRIVLTVLLAGFMCLGSGDMAFAGEFQTEEEGSAPEEELFTDGVPEQPEVFSAEGEENKEIFSKWEKTAPQGERNTNLSLFSNSSTPFRAMLTTLYFL